MNATLTYFLLAASAAAARAEEPLDPAVVRDVGEYLTTKDADRAARLESDLAGQPIAVLERAIREAPLPAATAGDAEFEITVPGDGAKARVYVHVPESSGGALPLLLSMHGHDNRGTEERDRWKAQKTGAILVCPEEQEKLWGKGWDSTEPERALEIAALDEALRRFPVDPERVFLAGYSRGGHATWELGMLFPDRFAALFSNSGGPGLGTLGWMDSLGQAPLLVALGLKDEPSFVEYARDAVKQVKAAHVEVVLREHADRDHVTGNTDDPEFARWIGQKKRDLFPKHVVHSFSRLNQGRDCWLEATALAADVADPPLQLKEIRPPDGKKLSFPQLCDFYRSELPKRVARFEGLVQGQKVLIRTQRVEEVAVWLSPRLLDLSKPVEIWIDGVKRFGGAVGADAAILLRHVRDTGDRGLLFHAKIVLRRAPPK